MGTWARTAGDDRGRAVEADIAVGVRSERGTGPRFPAAFGAEAVSDLGALMERCDAVWICTPTVAHRSAVDAAVDRGRAIFCEKPLATASKAPGLWSPRSQPPRCPHNAGWSCVRPRCSGPCATWWLRARWAGHGGRLPRRSVFPDPGRVRLTMACRRGPGRWGLPDRTLHPRRGYPGSTASARWTSSVHARRTSPATRASKTSPHSRCRSSPGSRPT